MTAPLVVLAVLSAVGGFVGLPKLFGENANLFERFLEPIFPKIPWARAADHPLAHSTEWLLIGISIAVASGGAVLAWLWYTREEGRIPGRITQAFPEAYALVADKFRIDELYNILIVRPFGWLAHVLWKVVDVLIIDGVLNAGAFLVELAGDVLRFLQTGNVRNYALTFFLGLIGLMLLVLGLGF